MIFHASLVGRRFKVLLFLLDILGIASAFAFALTLRLNADEIGESYSIFVVLFSGINLIWLYLFDLYKLEPRQALWKRPLQTAVASFVAAISIVFLAYFIGAIEFKGLIGRGVLFGAQLSFAVWAGAWRFIFSKWARAASDRTRWLVLSNEENLSPILSDLHASGISGQFCILTEGPRSSALDAVHSASRASFSQNSNGIDGRAPHLRELSVNYLGEWKEFENQTHQPWTGVVAAADTFPDDILSSLMELRLKGTRIFDLVDFYEETWSKVPVFYLRRSWFALSQGFQLLHNPIGLRVKRMMDFSCAFVLLILASPILCLAALAIKFESRGPIFYRQTRVGENGRTFQVIKLRSMRVDAEKDGAQWSTANDRRITRVGGFIRATRIDELPQLLCVLRGEMSFIGPRPERPEFTVRLDEQIPFYNMRHVLRPGVTGWAQVMYPYGASVEDARQKLQYDLYYIKNYSLLLDAAIILKTVRVVLFGKGR